jgi:hypothetical protein
MKIVAFRGAAFYEFQIGRLWLKWCHFKGEYWDWKPWRRVKMGWETSDE